MLKPLKSAKTAQNLLYSYIPTFLHSFIPTFLHYYIPILLHSYIPSFHHSILLNLILKKSCKLFGGYGQASNPELWYLDRVPSSLDSVKIFRLTITHLMNYSITTLVGEQILLHRVSHKSASILLHFVGIFWTFFMCMYS